MTKLHAQEYIGSPLVRNYFTQTVVLTSTTLTIRQTAK